MKVTSLKLSSRKDYNQKKNTTKALSEKHEEYWVTHGYAGYSYKLRRTKSACLIRQNNDTPRLTVTNLFIDEFPQFSTGSSMEKWAKKTPRFRSSKCKRNLDQENNCDDVEEENCMTYFDFRNVLTNCDESRTNQDQEGVVENVHVPEDKIYEVSSDIEKLLVRSQQASGYINEENQSKRKNKKCEDKKKCKKKTKTIKFSISRPPSPETEQVIRVDVTTNVSLEDLKEIKASYDCSQKKKCVRMKSTKNVSENADHKNNENDNDEDSFIRVRGLLLATKKNN